MAEESDSHGELDKKSLDSEDIENKAVERFSDQLLINLASPPPSLTASKANVKLFSTHST